MNPHEIPRRLRLRRLWFGQDYVHAIAASRTKVTWRDDPMGENVIIIMEELAMNGEYSH